MCLFADVEPLTFVEASKDKKWIQAMDKEIQAIERNDAWEVVAFPSDHQAIGVKWMYKMKKKAEGEVENTKRDLPSKDTTKSKGLTTKKYLLPLLAWRPFVCWFLL